MVFPVKNRPHIKEYGSIEYSFQEKYKREDLSIITDIFSLGIVLYEIFTDKLPFTSINEDKEFKKNLQELVEKIKNGEIKLEKTNE